MSASTQIGGGGTYAAIGARIWLVQFSSEYYTKRSEFM